MTVKFFVLGLPGAGKSTVARFIAISAMGNGWLTTRFNDYTTLQKMFRDDTEGKQFKPAEHGGFDVLNLTVFDTALQRLEQEITKYISSAKSDEIIVIEFSRNDYRKAFLQFSHEFLHDAYFLYLDVDLETCKKRIHERIANPGTDDDFFVSEYIFRTYYNKDNGRHLPRLLERNYTIDKQRVMIIDNNGPLESSTTRINWFITTICTLESVRR